MRIVAILAIDKLATTRHPCPFNQLLTIVYLVFTFPVVPCTVLVGEPTLGLSKTHKPSPKYAQNWQDGTESESPYHIVLSVSLDTAPACNFQDIVHASLCELANEWNLEHYNHMVDLIVRDNDASIQHLSFLYDVRTCDASRCNSRIVFPAPLCPHSRSNPGPSLWDQPQPASDMIAIS